MNAIVAPNIPGTFAYSKPLGTVLSAGNGQQLQVTFSPTDSNYQTSTSTVSINVLKIPTSLNWTTPADITVGTPLTAVQLNATISPNIPGIFTYTPPSGTVLPAGNKQLQASFIPTDSLNYSASTTSVYLNVLVVGNWNTPADIVYGTMLSSAQLNATSDVPGTYFYYGFSNYTPLTVGSHQIWLAFFPNDAHYATVYKTVTINVVPAAPAILWNKPAGILYGTAIGSGQLNAAAGIAGTFSYTPAAGTILSAGIGQTLSVVFTPADTSNYLTTTKTVLIDVARATPVITWATPANIMHGTALDAQQLNAHTNVSLKFIYSPTPGTILDRGSNQVLSVTVNPVDEDAVNYTSASATVLINVLNNPPVIASTAAAFPNPAIAGQSISFSASATDAENDPLTYYWVFSDSGIHVSGAATTHIFSAAGTYTAQVHVSDSFGGIASSTVSVIIKSPTTVSFQDGMYGYSGTQDTYISSSQPTTKYGSSIVLQPYTNSASSALIKWDLSSIPAGSTIQSAQITLSSAADSISIYQAKCAWSENGATWRNFNGGQLWQTAGGIGNNDRDSISLKDSSRLNTLIINSSGLAVIQGWVNNSTTNNGFFLNWSSGISINSREWFVFTSRPKLTVTYLAP